MTDIKTNETASGILFFVGLLGKRRYFTADGERRLQIFDGNTELFQRQNTNEGSQRSTKKKKKKMMAVALRQTFIGSISQMSCGLTSLPKDVLFFYFLFFSNAQNQFCKT